MQLLTIFVLIITVSGISTAADDNCTQSINTVNCCPFRLVSMYIIGICTGTYGDMQTKKDALPGPRRGCCVGDCMTEKLGVNPKGDGNIDRGLLKTKLQQHMNGDASLISTFNDAFDNCFASADAKAVAFQQAYELKPAFDGEKMCHPISRYLLNCISNEMFINCPTHISISDTKCDDLKKYVKMCGELADKSVVQW